MGEAYRGPVVRVGDPSREIDRLREALTKARDTLGANHVVEEGPNAGWREDPTGQEGWYEEDLVCRADCAVCAAIRTVSAVLDEVS